MVKECARHGCEVTATKRCRYCKDHFCAHHVRAIPPGLPNFEKRTPVEELWHEEARKGNNHPCPDCVEAWEEEHREIGRQADEALDELMPRAHREYAPSSSQSEGPSSSIPWWFWVFAVCVALFLIYTYWDSLPVQTFSHMPSITQTCTDGTAEGQCSADHQLCTNRTLHTAPQQCGCPSTSILKDGQCRPKIRCSDGTLEGECSGNKPYVCMPDGGMAKRPQQCGCNADAILIKGECVPLKKCSDGTLLGSCSSTQPFYCGADGLTPDTAQCGCPTGTVADGDQCRSPLQTQPRSENLKAVVNTWKYTTTFTVYGGLADQLRAKPRTYICNPTCPTDEAIERMKIEEANQVRLIQPLIEAINDKFEGDDRARAAISFVQNIPYDDAGVGDTTRNRYPYEVLYDNAGVCGEKSRLLALLLKELGYGTALFRFDKENHMAVGVRCPQEYSYLDSGYCFIETTSPSIPTYDNADYVTAGKLRSTPLIFHISDGASFVSIGTEFQDGITWDILTKRGEHNNGYLDQNSYLTWKNLQIKYGMN